MPQTTNLHARSAAALAAVFALLLAAPAAHAQLAAGQAKYLGSVLDGRPGKEQPIPPRFHELFNQVSPENSGKWANVEHERDVMDFGALDEHYAYARDRGLPFLLHSITRQEKEPDWLRRLPPDEIRAEFEEWIATLAQRYPDVYAIDVINEGGHYKLGSPELVAALGGSGATGWDAYVEVYRLARQYWPEAILLLNDYSIIEFESSQVPGFDALVRVLAERDLIDGLGLQGHFLQWKPLDKINRRINEVVANSDLDGDGVGLPVYITEFDLPIERDDYQRFQYTEVFRTLWEHPAVQGVTLWGYEEGNTWLDHAHILNNDGTERPALVWLREYLRGPVKPAAGLEAERYDALYGMTGFGRAVPGQTPPQDYLSVASDKDSAYVSWRYVNLGDANQMTLRYRSDAAYDIAIRLDDPAAVPTATATLPSTDGEWATASVSMSSANDYGTRDVYVGLAPVGTGGAFDVDQVGFGQAPLPATLVAFGAAPDGGAVAVTWTTAGESGVEAFAVERSHDGQSFSTLGEVAAAGDVAAGQPRDYGFRDAAPLSGVSYYRLRTRDRDGDTALSETVAVTTGASGTWTLLASPNPGRGGELAVETRGLAAGPVEIVVRDVTGRVVHAETLAGGADSRTSLALAHPLARGTYLLAAAGRDGREETVLVVVR